MEIIKRNIVLILAFSLPLVFVFVVALMVYLPSLFFSTNYNFVYVTCNSQKSSYYYDCNVNMDSKFKIMNNKITVVDIAYSLDFNNTAKEVNDITNYRFFIHDTKSNTSREITLNEALGTNLDSGLSSSPDGAIFTQNYGNNGYYMFPFGGYSNDRGYYLVRGKSRLKLNLINSDVGYYYNNIKVLGWIKK